MKPAATPASIALPPAPSTRAAACAASGCPAATIHFRPITCVIGPEPAGAALRWYCAESSVMGGMVAWRHESPRAPDRREHVHHGRHASRARVRQLDLPARGAAGRRRAGRPAAPALRPRRCGSSLRELGGLLLTGGGDIDPALFDETPHATLYDVAPSRDTLETAVLHVALERGRAGPRGVPRPPGAERGARRQPPPGRGHRARHPDPAQPERAARPAHPQGEGHAGQPARRDPGRRRARGQQHAPPGDQAAGPGARPRWRGRPTRSSRVRSSTIAARFVLGVQWHPEELVGHSEPARRLFAALVAAARKS